MSIILCLFLSMFVEMDIGQVSREFMLFSVVVFAVTDEKKNGHGYLIFRFIS